MDAYAVYVPSLGGEPLPMTRDYTSVIAAGQAWVVSRDGEDLAVVILEPAADHLLIFSLAIRPEAQGGGLGRWMLAFAEAQARARALPELRLYTHPAMTRNIRIYEQAGYEHRGRRPNPYRPGWELIDMAKTL